MAFDQEGRVREGAGMFLGMLRKDGTLYAAILIYIALAGLSAAYVGVLDRYSVLVYPATTLMVVMVMAASGLFVFSAYVILIEKPVSAVSRIMEGVRHLLVSEGFFRSLPLLLAFTLFFSAVSSFKALIPSFQPFVWDADFMALDKMLHGGRQPWEWLQPALGYPWITVLINAVYNLWFFVMFLVLFWQMLDTHNESRRRKFLLAFVLIWGVNGSLLAVLFSSAGPCFLDRLFPEEANPFMELMVYLKNVNQVMPVWALQTQEALWVLYSRNEIGAGAGISAMPSMHVSVAWLIFLLLRKEREWMRWLAGLFFLFILIGSVHLGWHYAVDGYLAVLTTSLVWMMVKWTEGVRLGVRWRGAA
ncbi:phosphatase PAP2 family protein [Alcanivorax sp. S6407]|uniref:phosphatase PAP2 family protein n=1 Tax=Alcanivorax sp. S6407 TaxID=2926424 RepID=UPI001FF62861|nr:phosphatase PAP2 family protein [Alcanivorax sp. S6407]MCK0154652.1 phosphatase PAP2 family protein [Alcanivorax sp. S6407]